MSSSTSTAKSLRTPIAPGDSAGYDRFIDQQVEKTGAQVKLFDLCSSLMVLGAGILSFLLVVTVLDHWVVPLGVGGRWAALVLLAGGSSWYLIRIVLPLLLGRVNPLFAARTIEHSEPTLKNSLINFLLFRSDRAGVRAVVYQALEQRAATDLKHVPIDTAVDRSRLIRFGYLLAGVLVVCAAYTILAPKSPFQSIARVLAPWADIAKPSRVRIEDVQPGNVEVYQGEHVVVAADCYDLRRGEPVTVRYTTQDEQLGLQAATMQPTAGLLRHECRLPADEQGVQRDVTYWIEAGDARTAAYQVRVVPAPVILVDAIEYEYPAYTRLPKRVSERQGDIKAAEGTRVTVRARANQPIAAAVLEFDPPPETAGQAVRASSRSLTQGALAASPHWIEMQFSGQEARCSFVCEMNDQRLEPKHRSYQLRFSTADGQRNPQPVLHRIDVLRDLPPEIEILTPTQDRVEVPEDGWQKIEIRAVDPDYGLTAIRLRATAGGQQVLARDLLQDPAGRQGQEIVTFDFAPRTIGLRAGSEAKCWAVAEDNRAAPGSGSPEPNVVKSREITLIVTRPAAGAEPDQRGDQKQGPAAAKSGGSRKPDGQGGAAPPDGNSQSPAPSQQTPEAGNPQQGTDAKQPSGGSAGDSGSAPQAGDSSQTPQAGGSGGNADSSSGPDGSESQPSGGDMTGGGNSSDGNSAGTQSGGGTASSQTGDSGTQSGSPGGADSSAGAESGAGQSAEPLHDGEAFEKAMDHMQQSGERPGQDAPGSAGSTSQAADQGAQKSSSGTTPENASGQGTSSDAGQQSKSQSGGQPQPATGAGQMGKGTESESPKPGESPSGAGGQQGAGPKEAAGQQQPDKNQGGGQPQQGTPSSGGEQQGPMQQENQAKKSPSGGGQKTEPGQSDGGQSGSGKANESRGGSGGGQNPEGNSQRQASSGDGEPRPNEEPQTPSMSRKTSGSQGDAGGDRSGSGKKGGGQGGNQPGQENPGNSSSADQGAGKSQESGSGDLAQRPGDKQQAEGQTGASGSEPGSGSQSKPAKDGAAGAGEQGDSTRNGPSTSPPQAPSSTAPSQGGQGLPLGGGNPSSADLQGGDLSGEVPDGERPNLDYARKATDLVLEYLKDQQTNPDEELLKKLGWTTEDLQDFVRRWSELKRTAREDQRAKQELDDALRSLGLRPATRDPRRTEVRQDPRRAERNLGTQSNAPPAYSEQFDAYRKGTARVGQPREAGR